MSTFLLREDITSFTNLQAAEDSPIAREDNSASKVHACHSGKNPFSQCYTVWLTLSNQLVVVLLAAIVRIY